MVCACDLPFTPLVLCNEAFINKIGLSPFIFVPSPEEVSCVVHSCDSICGLWFTNLVLPSDLCARMLGRLETKVRETLRIGSTSLGWLGAKILKTPYFR